MLSDSCETDSPQQESPVIFESVRNHRRRWENNSRYSAFDYLERIGFIRGREKSHSQSFVLTKVSPMLLDYSIRADDRSSGIAMTAYCIIQLQWETLDPSNVVLWHSWRRDELFNCFFRSNDSPINICVCVKVNNIQSKHFRCLTYWSLLSIRTLIGVYDPPVDGQ